MNNFKVFTIFIVILLVAGSFGLAAQSMEVMDQLLSQEAAEFGESIYLIAVGSGAVGESASIADAMETAADRKWISKNTDPDSAVTVGMLSLAVMRAFDIDGGIMYKLFKSPRYAARELAYLELLPAEAHPGNNLSGIDVVAVVAGAAEFKEAE